MMEDKKTFWIEFIGDRSVKIREDQSILQASLEAGIQHYHACGGKGECSTCRVLVKEGISCLSPMTEKETHIRKRIALPLDVRLACQTFIHCGPVKLHRIIRDDKDMQIYTQDKNTTNQVGEEKEMALFFLDIRNFTPFMETYPAFDVIHILRRMFELFRKAIENHEGKIIETAGDGLYAVFGFDTTIQEAVKNSIKAGHVLLEELNNFNESYLSKNFYHQFEVGIGLHAGRVITGNIGLGVNNNITVMGLPVNIASRLQASTKKLNNSFVISDVIYKMMEEKLEIKSATINLKGIKKAFKVYMIGQGYKHHLQFEGIS